MSHPLCAIGGAVLEVIGLNPRAFEGSQEANWPAHEVFGEEPYYQPTGLGERTMKVRLAARPHMMGGLGAFAALERHLQTQDVVPFIRLTGIGPRPAGRFMGDVTVRRLSSKEEKLAPNGVGWRWEFDAELLFVGAREGGF